MSILKLKDSQGNWIGVPTLKGDKGNGISSAILNNDYTLTLTFTDGTTYTTPSIRGEKGEQGEPATDMEIHICSSNEYDSETRIPTIENPNDKTFYLVPTEDGTSPDLFTEWVYVNDAWEMFGSAKIDLSGYLTDVQINGTSIVSDGVANIPVADGSSLGVVGTNSERGIGIDKNTGRLYISSASIKNIKAGGTSFLPITPYTQHASIFYGLAKSAGDTTQSQSSNAVGNYTDNAKDSIQNMLGITPLIASHETDPFESNHVVGELFIIGGKLYRAKIALTAGEYINEGTNVEVVSVAGVLDSKVDDVQINGTSIVTDGVANVPVASSSALGVAKVHGDYGIVTYLTTLQISMAEDYRVKAGASQWKPIVPYNQHMSTFYGLAKAAGDTTQSASSNAVGTYTVEAKSKIQDMIGIDDWQLVAEETLSEDGGFDITIANSAREVYIYAEIEIASGGTSLVIEAYSDSGMRAYFQTFGGQISTSKKAITVVQLIPIATEIKALAYFGKDVYTNSGHFDWQHKSFAVGKLNRFKITAYGGTIQIPTGSIVRIFAR